MPQISLTDLVDIMAAGGMGKYNKVQAVKNRPAYDPRTDFYKALREGIIGVHKDRGTKNDLARITKELTDPKKKDNYPEAIRGYRTWWGRKTVTWAQPPKGKFCHDDVEVSVNPELGLIIDGQRHVVKLYFKAEKLSKLRIGVAANLMHHMFAGRPTEKGTTYSVLDVRRGRAYSFDSSKPPAIEMLRAEMAYISAAW